MIHQPRRTTRRTSGLRPHAGAARARSIAAVYAACACAPVGLPWLAPAALAQSCPSPEYPTTLINISAPLSFEQFLVDCRSVTDVIDANGDGIVGPEDRLWGNCTPENHPGRFDDPDWWRTQARITGPYTALCELLRFGLEPAFTGQFDCDGGSLLRASDAIRAYAGPTLYIDGGVPLSSECSQQPGIANCDHPGCAPLVHLDPFGFDHRATTIDFSPGCPTGIRIDAAGAEFDPAAGYAVPRGTPSPLAQPATPGYGFSPRVVRSPSGAPLQGEPISLPHLSECVPADAPTPNFDRDNPNEKTIYASTIAVDPIAVAVNPGTGLQRLTYSQIQYLLVTGRLPSGENLTVISRPLGDAYRTAVARAVGVDPAWAGGENIGPSTQDDNNDRIGPGFIPSSKPGDIAAERTALNSRLGLTFLPATQGFFREWIFGSNLQIVAVADDVITGAGEFGLPSARNLLNDNDPGRYTLLAPRVLATFGDPAAEPGSNGGLDAPHPPVPNTEAAKYVNNTLFGSPPLPFGGISGTPAGALISEQLTPIAALSEVVDPAAGQFEPNPYFSSDIAQAFFDQSVLADPVYEEFDEDANGLVPFRQPGPTYSDGVPGGGSYIEQSGEPVFYGDLLATRNRVAGDFSGDRQRNLEDIGELVRAFTQRQNWSAPDGPGAPFDSTDLGARAVIEILGDFDGDGSFLRRDVRFFADGLAIDPGTGQLDRKAGFELIDLASQQQTGVLNFFGTQIATGNPYQAGFSRADVAGGGPATPGWAPNGPDGVVDLADVDYVVANFGDWSSLAAAALMDLSCDMDGDLDVDPDDALYMISTVLNTLLGDLNLDGKLDFDDLDAWDPEGDGYSDGDINFDGEVDDDDLAALRELICDQIDYADPPGTFDLFDILGFFEAFASGDPLAVPTADLDRDGDLDVFDIVTFFDLFGQC